MRVGEIAVAVRLVGAAGQREDDGGRAGERRIADRVGRADPVGIGVAGGEADVAVGRGVRGRGGERRPPAAVRGAFDPEARLVARVIRPGEVDLGRRKDGSGQSGRGGRQREDRGTRDVGVRGVTGTAVGADPVIVLLARGQAGVAVVVGIHPERRERRPGGAVRASLDPEPGLVRRGVRPGKVDLRGGRRGRAEAGRRGRRRGQGRDRDGIGVRRIAAPVVRAHPVGIRGRSRQPRVGPRGGVFPEGRDFLVGSARRCARRGNRPRRRTCRTR